MAVWSNTDLQSSDNSHFEARRLQGLPNALVIVDTNSLELDANSLEVERNNSESSFRLYFQELRGKWMVPTIILGIDIQAEFELVLREASTH